MCYLQPRFVGLERIKRRHDGVDVDVRHHDTNARLLAAVRQLNARHVEPTAAVYTSCYIVIQSISICNYSQSTVSQHRLA